MGIRRETESREKAETEAMLPVEKKADWRRVRKKRDVRASERVRERNGDEVREAWIAGEVWPFVAGLEVGVLEM
jgi:hypothetical protein